MDNEDCRKIIDLLQQIRDGQRRMLEHQAQALARQNEAFSLQRERQAQWSQQTGLADNLVARAGQLQDKSASHANRAFLTLFLVVFVAIIWW